MQPEVARKYAVMIDFNAVKHNFRPAVAKDNGKADFASAVIARGMQQLF
jgi:hypothetical protein